MSRPILLAALVLSMFGCVGSSPTGPTKGAAASKPPTSTQAPTGAPNYAGNWSGDYLITTCLQTQEVARANICGALGQSSSYRLSITQNGQSVTVSATVGTVRFPSVTVPIGHDGRVALSTETTSDGFYIAALFGLAMPETGLTGTIKHVWTSSALLGRTTVMGRIVTAERTTQSTP
jgi:hypothetical protein